jgi:Bacterial PH domain
MRFAAPWDRMLRIATTVSVLVLAAVVAVPIGLATAGVIPPALGLFIACVPALTLGIAFAFSPRGYAIEAGRLRIERPLRAIEVPLASIRAAGALPDDAFRGAMRVAGSGGLFGYYGRFWSRRLGAFRLYATRRTGLVLVDTATDRFVLAPEPPDRFLDVLFAHAASASRALPDALPPVRPLPRRVKVGLAALLAVLPLVFVVTFALAWAWSPVAARVDADAIRIERRLAPEAVIPLADVRSVEPMAPEYARRLWRVSGASASGGARYGHFRSRELGDVQLYAWHPGAYVLLETGSGRVVLTPDDRDAFVAAVRTALRR